VGDLKGLKHEKPCFSARLFNFSAEWTGLEPFDYALNYQRFDVSEIKR
jgi:hypothetical protein